MKFSIVTPVYNMEKYISETIESVLSQSGDFEIEYIIRDGGSTDKTLEMAKSYEKRLTDGTYSIQCKKVTLQILTEHDFGMYDAINKGFLTITGDILAWINADDRYLPEAFKVIAKCFEIYPETQWIKGVTKIADHDGTIVSNGSCRVYHRDWIQRGIYGRDAYFVEQDSVFWRRSLWQKTGLINPNLKNAGDYELWIKMAKHAPLQSLNFPISVFRKLSDSLTNRNGSRYSDEQKIICPSRSLIAWKARLFFNMVYRTPNSLRSILQQFYYRLYSLIFHNLKGERFIEVTDGHIEMKLFKSYEVGAN